ncbi:MAG: glutathionylspermidine synthase family protein [Candidatus Omnitrophica bacterium]|nr:glutathionylspermidine synthase family protein [Candidatus Omnitrophota bacterium]
MPSEELLGEWQLQKNFDYAYDEYLKAHQDRVVSAIAAFKERLERTHFHYGRFAIPTFYKSHFLTPKQEHLIKRVSSTMTQILNTAIRLYFEEVHLSHLYRIPQDAAELIKIDPGYSQNVVFCRYNTMLEGERFKIMEFNVDSSAGAAYTDQVESLLMHEEPLRDFFHEYHLKGSQRVENILHALLETYEEFGGTETPTIAIMDWKHVRTMSEFEYLKSFFEERGYKTLIVDPREFGYKSGKLYHKNTRIHLIYRRAEFNELLERIDEIQDMIKAYRDRAVCMVNPLRSRLASTKAVLSILTNPEYDHFFTDNENKIKREHIPWTRRLADAEDFYGHKKIYLIDFLKDEKESLVLKPSSGSGGKDVTIGSETPDQDWNAALDKAVKGDWVVQEFVPIPIMTVPEVINGKLDFSYKKYNFNAYVFGGKYSGGLVRLSNESVINIARGGGLIPSLATEVIPERMEA